MPNVTIKASDFDRIVRDYLKQYGDDAFDSVRAVADEVGKETAKRLRRFQFTHSKVQHTGIYSRGWTMKTNSPRVGYHQVIVHNAGKHGSLTHLIENGHPILSRTGKVKAISPPYEHIAPEQEWAQEEFERRIVERIGEK